LWLLAFVKQNLIGDIRDAIAAEFTLFDWRLAFYLI
jgi:hypothetical protein